MESVIVLLSRLLNKEPVTFIVMVKAELFGKGHSCSNAESPGTFMQIQEVAQNASHLPG